MRWWTVVIASSLACSGSPRVSAPPSPTISNVAPTPVRVPPQKLQGPTLATAGAKACEVGAAVLLGPHGEGDAVLGFDGEGGIAAWKPTPTELTVQPLASDGAKRGAPTQIAVPAELEPKNIYAVGEKFVVLLRLWGWKTQDLRWWGVVVDRAGHAAKGASDLGLADLDLGAVQILDDRRIAMIVMPGYIAKRPNAPGRWQTLMIEADGSLSSTPTTIDLRGLEGVYEEAELGGARGWIVTDNGVRKADGVFDGKRVPAAGAVVAPKPDTLG